MADLKESVRRDALAKHLAWFSQVRRDTGGPGEAAAAAYIAGELERYGIPVIMHEFDAFLSYPRRARLEVVPTGESFRCVTHSFAASTPSEGVELELTVGSKGDMAGAAGRAVMLEGLCEPGPVYRYSQAGAGALIFSNRDRVIHNMIATTIWGTPTPDQLHRLPTLPVVSINRRDGDTLKDLAAAGGVRVRITTEVETGWFRSLLPEVRIPGTEDPELFVMAGGHYCAWDVGVTDNATGTTLLMEMARLLWERRGELKRGVRICWWPGHSHGRYAGSTWYADTFFDEISRGCVVYHNIDSPGVRGATAYVCRHTTAEMEGFIQGMIKQVTGQANAPVHRPGRAADQSFVGAGVAAFSCYPFLPEDHPDRRPWTGGCAGAWWWHTPDDDTLDKASVDVLSLDTELSTSAVLCLCQAPVLPIDHRAVARQIRTYLDDLAAELGEGHLDLGPARAKTEALADAAAGRQSSATADTAGVNRALLKASRALLPVMYSKGGRFSHDPADLVPPQHNRAANVFPALTPAYALPKLAGARDYGFLRAAGVRELNRICAGLDEAVAALRQAAGAEVHVSHSMGG